MIIARLFGGLGNQLFIYAAARRFAAHANTSLMLDERSGFIDDPYRRFPELNHFAIAAKRVGRLGAMSFPGGRIARWAMRRTGGCGPISFVKEPDHRRFHGDVLTGRPAPITFVEGYWQSPRYFEDIGSSLRRELEFVGHQEREDQEWARRISCHSQPVALHARRLYALGSEGRTSGPQPLNTAYYIEGIRRVLAVVPGAHVFCFGDDPDWIRSELRLDAPMTVVGHNSYGSRKAIGDFRLMSLCRHFVIANSTFSWWAAWLGEKDGSVVVAPGPEHWDNRDILPSRWCALGR